MFRVPGNTITDLNKLHAAIMAPAPTSHNWYWHDGARARGIFVWCVASFISFSCFNFKGNIFCDETTVVSIWKRNFIEFYQIYINKFCSDCSFYRIYWIYRIEPSKTNGQNEIWNAFRSITTYQAPDLFSLLINDILLGQFNSNLNIMNGGSFRLFTDSHFLQVFVIKTSDCTFCYFYNATMAMQCWQGKCDIYVLPHRILSSFQS